MINVNVKNWIFNKNKLFPTYENANEVLWSTISLERNVCKMELPSHSHQSFRADRNTKKIVKVPPTKTNQPAFRLDKSD